MRWGAIAPPILRASPFGRVHGHAAAKSIERAPQDAPLAVPGPLCPAPHRLERRR
jgi:hypothetical protein